MSLTTAKVQSAFVAIRSKLPGSTVTIAYVYQDVTYTITGVRAAQQTNPEIMPGRGELQNVEGAVRVSVADLPGSEFERTVNEGLKHPKTGDPITVNGAKRVVVLPEYDQMRGTVRINYGARYG